MGMATKKTPTKKSAPKKPTTRKPAAKAKAASGAASDFMTFRVTKETFHWVVLGVVVLLFTVWILRLQSDVQSLYDEIEIRQADTDSTFVQPTEPAKKTDDKKN